MSKSTNLRTTRRVRAVLGAAVAACAATALLPAAASAEPTPATGHAAARETGVERVSVAPDGTQADDNSTGASITPDGLHLVFSSSAQNLTPDTPAAGDRVYVRDQHTSQTKRMGSLTPLQPPVISGDGKYVAYPVQWFNDARIRQYQVSTGNTASLNCSAYSCNQPSLNADGRYTAYAIRNLRQPSSGHRVEFQDWNTGTTQTVATLPHAQPSRPSISGDGSRVAYQDGQAQDVFVWDRAGATTSGPVEGPSKAATIVQLSDDGSKVVYLSGSDTYVHDVSSGTAQLVPNVRGVAIDPTGRYLLHAPRDTTGPSLSLRDLQTGTDEIVSNQPASAGTDAVSTDGRSVVFHSTADDLVPGDTNGKSDVFVRHFD
ncbi:WD40 repeat domain-containing protein [Streptomyces sp. NPDC058308]|uniref:WD40 repeat domain-containing protein n=1 Tax=Streptomyces sp. NPDC058308 TaxID=3346440 RepID=UPI0036F162CD